MLKIKVKCQCHEDEYSDYDKRREEADQADMSSWQDELEN